MGVTDLLLLLLNTKRPIPPSIHVRLLVPRRRSRRGASGKRPGKSRRRRWRRGASHWLSRTWGRRVWGQSQVLLTAPGNISEEHSSNHFITRCYLGREPRRCGTASTSWSRRSLTWLRRWRGRSMRWAPSSRTSKTDERVESKICFFCLLPQINVLLNRIQHAQKLWVHLPVSPCNWVEPRATAHVRCVVLHIAWPDKMTHSHLRNVKM